MPKVAGSLGGNRPAPKKSADLDDADRSVIALMGLDPAEFKKARAAEVTKLRVENKPTIPVLLGNEKKANVFLRADDASVAVALHMKGKSAADVFGELRERKNKS